MPASIRSDQLYGLLHPAVHWWILAVFHECMQGSWILL